MDEKILKKFSDADHCPVRNVLERFGDKWSLLPHLHNLAQWAIVNMDEIKTSRQLYENTLRKN